ncbi:MAG: amidohydrolase family protein [Pseudomonadota bacterium]
MDYDLIIRNVRIKEHAPSVDIGIKEGNIKIIGNIKDPVSQGREINAEHNLIIPGFVNSHTHLDKADLLSKMKPSQFGGTLEENRTLIREFKENYTIEEIKERAGKVIKEMVEEGITAIRTQVDVDPTAKLLPLKAICELRKEYAHLVSIEICAFPQEGVIKQGARDLLEQALNDGADLLGGLPLVEKTEKEQREHIDVLFEIAKNYDVDIEVQIDESNNPKDFMLPYLVEKTIKESYQGRVSATHCISLSKVDNKIASEVIKKIKESGINIILTPSCNLITSFPETGESRPYNSITRVKDLVENEVNVAMGTDNIRDIFYPLGNGSMIREMHVLATTTRMSRIEDVENIFEMATLNGAKILNLNYGIETGRQADLLVTNSVSKRQIISSREFIPYVIKNGKVVSVSKILNN